MQQMTHFDIALRDFMHVLERELPSNQNLIPGVILLLFILAKAAGIVDDP